MEYSVGAEKRLTCLKDLSRNPELTIRAIKGIKFKRTWTQKLTRDSMGANGNYLTLLYIDELWLILCIVPQSEAFPESRHVAFSILHG